MRRQAYVVAWTSWALLAGFVLFVLLSGCAAGNQFRFDAVNTAQARREHRQAMSELREEHIRETGENRAKRRTKRRGK